MKLIRNFNPKLLIIITLISLVLNLTLNVNNNLKANKKNSSKSKNDYINKMKQYYELVLDKSKFSDQRNSKKCWDYLWSKGLEDNENLKNVISDLRQEKIQPFMDKPTTSSLDVKKDFRNLLNFLGDKVTIGLNSDITCKSDLLDVINPTANFSNVYLYDKLQKIFEGTPIDVEGRLFVTSAASVHRDLPFRNPNLWEILNDH